MKQNKLFGALFVLGIFIVLFVFAGNTQGHHGVGEFDLHMDIKEGFEIDQFHVKKSFAKRVEEGYISIRMSNDPRLSCENGDELLLDGQQKILTLDLFAPEGESISDALYKRKEAFKLGPSVRLEDGEVLFGGMDVGHVEITEIHNEEGFIAGEVKLRDIENRVVEGSFEAEFCE